MTHAHTDSDGRLEAQNAFVAEPHHDGHRVYSTYPLRICNHCLAPRLERRHRRGLWQGLLSLISVFPYKCRNCFRYQYCFVATGQLAQTLIILLLLATVGVLGSKVLKGMGSGCSADGANMSEADAAYRARATTGGLTPFEKMMLAKKKQVLRNEDVSALVRSGVERALIIKMIQTSGNVYDLTPQGVMQLKHQGVDETIITSMIDHTTQTAANGGQ